MYDIFNLDNNIICESLNYLIRRIVKKPELVTLNLRGNNINEDGLSIMIDKLKNCSRNIEIDISGIIILY